MRVILDPHGRLRPNARVLSADGTRRLVVTTPGAACALADGVEVVRLAADNGHIAPAAVLAALAARGLRRILIEGGARTVSGFMSAGCLDRLHMMVAPIILGTGRAGLTLAPIERSTTRCGRRPAPIRSARTSCSIAISRRHGCRSAGRKYRRDRL